MKYLNRFNEKLKSETYGKAAAKLKELGHISRAEELLNWQTHSKHKEDVKYVKDLQEKWSKLGTFNVNILKGFKNPKLLVNGNFNIKFYFDKDWSYDILHDWVTGNYKYSLAFPFEICLIPADDETIERMLNLDMQDSYFFDRCCFYGNRFWLEVSKPGDDRITSVHKINFDSPDDEFFEFADRKSAVKFRKSLSDVFTGEVEINSDYKEKDFLLDIRNYFKEIYNNLEENLNKYEESELKRILTSRGIPFEKDGNDYKKLGIGLNTVSINSLYKN